MKIFVFFLIKENEYLARTWVCKKNIQSISKLIPQSTQNKLLELERIKKSIPDSLTDLEKEKSFILNFNFDKLNAISFNKGCYIGQENTSRQNYRGKIKYLLKTVKLVDGAFPKINTGIFCKKTKIGVMKSHLENYGLVLLKSDDSIKEQLLILDDNICKLKVI